MPSSSDTFLLCLHVFTQASPLLQGIASPGKVWHGFSHSILHQVSSLSTSSCSLISILSLQCRTHTRQHGNMKNALCSMSLGYSGHVTDICWAERIKWFFFLNLQLDCVSFLIYPCIYLKNKQKKLPKAMHVEPELVTYLIKVFIEKNVLSKVRPVLASGGHLYNMWQHCPVICNAT